MVWCLLACAVGQAGGSVHKQPACTRECKARARSRARTRERERAREEEKRREAIKGRKCLRMRRRPKRIAVAHGDGEHQKQRERERERECKRNYEQDMGTSQHRLVRHDQKRLACVGWRLYVQPTAIAPYHPIRLARLGSCLNARARSSARVPKVAWRRTRLRSGGLGEPPLHRSADPAGLSRPKSGHLSQVSCQILLVSIAAAHRTPITCHFHRFVSSGGPVRVRRSAGVAGGGDGCHVSRPASIWDLRLALGCVVMVLTRAMPPDSIFAQTLHLAT